MLHRGKAAASDCLMFCTEHQILNMTCTQQLYLLVVLMQPLFIFFIQVILYSGFFVIRRGYNIPNVSSPASCCAFYMNNTNRCHFMWSWHQIHIAVAVQSTKEEEEGEEVNQKNRLQSARSIVDVDCGTSQTRLCMEASAKRALCQESDTHIIDFEKEQILESRVCLLCYTHFV